MVVDRAFGRDVSPIVAPGGGAIAQSVRSQRSSRSGDGVLASPLPHSTRLPEQDRYEWCVVFGGSRHAVQRMGQMSDDENPYLVLQQAFEDLRTPDGLKQMLETSLRYSSDGDKVFLLVGAVDDDVLMQEAQEIGFLKRCAQPQHHFKLASLRYTTPPVYPSSSPSSSSSSSSPPSPPPPPLRPYAGRGAAPLLSCRGAH
eukprot:COSAG01_NODE_3207_length_6420_cov_9.039393_5_plen_200_part_00